MNNILAASPLKMEFSKTTVNLTNCGDEVFGDHQVIYRLYGNMPISIIGIFANLLNIVVFADSEMRTLLMNHFLLALSISGSLRDIIIFEQDF